MNLQICTVIIMTKKTQKIESNWTHTTIQVSLVTSLTYFISPFVTKVSVLSNLRISGCELKDNYYVSFT